MLHFFIEYNSPDAYAATVAGWVGDETSILHDGSWTRIPSPTTCDPALYHVWRWETPDYEDDRPAGIKCVCGKVTSA